VIAPRCQAFPYQDWLLDLNRLGRDKAEPVASSDMSRRGVEKVHEGPDNVTLCRLWVRDSRTGNAEARSLVLCCWAWWVRARSAA
jgi:hypothetical protein